MCQHVVVDGGQLALPHSPRHRGSVLNDQGVGRNVVDTGFDSGVYRAQQVVVGLPGVP
ncbi:hypothetical protein I551_5932 [Mycobacterium ulcerans str. Harvey]|uniref:Uncharacterized protein n=1 Tax=Mycobacterium ulcerans str. Harvey TaxID=1299332 RepID=A0ABP3A7X8_MYCUL|nr:hypothetical protein I551_5932 [Mycobacterium ulcerans str. Harvey]